MSVAKKTEKRWEQQEDFVARVWSKRGYRNNTITNYLRIVRRIRPYLAGRRRWDDAFLTRRRVVRAAAAYARDHNLAPGRVIKDTTGALHAWAEGLRAIGEPVPPWTRPRGRDDAIEELLDEYSQHRRRYRGVAESSLCVECRFLRRFLLAFKRRDVAGVKLVDVDAFIAGLSTRMKPKTVAGACSALRSFLRFLHSVGTVPEDLSASVVGPAVRALDRPPRVLPWADVRRTIAAVDRRTSAGKRDYALLLTMATYGMGAAEVCGLRIDDIDWEKGTLRIVRRKTGVETLLPLLPPVAHALMAYLRHGRPRVDGVRTVFLRLIAPALALSGGPAICSLLRKYASKAGVNAPFLGSHALRHSHACRQVEQGVQPKVLSEILGHGNPNSVSVYSRVAMEQLRSVALPVPR